VTHNEKRLAEVWAFEILQPKPSYEETLKYKSPALALPPIF